MSDVVICALITGAFALLTARTNARAGTQNREIMSRLDRLEQLHHADSVLSERNDLLTAIKIDEDNSVEIMRIAKRYFLELKGNSYASKPFAAWAVRHHLDISELYTEHNDLKFYVENPSLCYDAYHKVIR